MKDYVVIICVKDTLSVVRQVFYPVTTLEQLKKDVNYYPEYEDYYAYEVNLDKPVYGTGPFTKAVK